MARGGQSCGTYLEKRRTPDNVYDIALAEWFYGFVSARNYYLSMTTQKVLDAGSILAYFDKYCRDAPLGSVSDAAIELTRSFEK